MRALVPIDTPTVGLAVRPDPLDQAAYDRFKGALRSWRDVLLAKMLRATGLRIMEVLRVEVRHCEVTGPDFAVLVKRGKQKRGTDLYERIYLPPQLGVELRDYIRGEPRGAQARIFTISDTHVRRLFKAAGLKSLGRSVHPHELRHLYIKTLLDGGVPIEAAAKLVGHSDPKTTYQWYYRLTADQRRAIQERMPV